MDTRKRKRLERAGWKVGNAEEFLDLSDGEAEYVAVRAALATAVVRQRERLGITQTAAAERVGSSQSRVAKMEAGDLSVSLDLMIRTLFKLGATRADLAKVIRHRAA